jgi:hypothetical protein
VPEIFKENAQRPDLIKQFGITILEYLVKVTDSRSAAGHPLIMRRIDLQLRFSF